MNEGDVAPGVAFFYPDARPGKLADFAGQKLLLIFLRHIG